jgi:hypothetical protein
MAEGDRGSRLRVAETILILFVLAFTYHELRDPARVLSWLFGELPPRSVENMGVRPWHSLLYGLNNVVIAAVIASLFVRVELSDWIRRGATAFLVITLLVVPLLRHIELRFHIDEAQGNELPYRSAIHDGGVAQTEMAVEALLDGKDPYATRYAAPPMSRAPDSRPEGWRQLGYDENPAYDHLPYPPGVVYAATVARLVGKGVFGRWDVRFLYLACAIALAAILGAMVRPGPARRMVWLATLVNPMLHGYLVLGRNDVLVLVPLALFAWFLLRERWRAASIALGCALLLKQFALFALPFLALVVWPRGGWRACVRRCWPAIAIPVAGSLPFLVWHPADFLEDVLLWNFGFGADAYPVRWDGYGATPLAYGLGLVDAPRGDNPLWWLFPVVTIGAAALLARWVRSAPTPARALVASGALSWAALFSSRFFADNYLVVPTLFLVTAWLGAPAAKGGDRTPLDGTPAGS